MCQGIDKCPLIPNEVRSQIISMIGKVERAQWKVVRPESREEFKKFLESNDPIAELVKGEGTPFGETCDKGGCENEYAILIFSGSMNYYLCPECFNELKECLENEPLSTVIPIKSLYPPT